MTCQVEKRVLFLSKKIIFVFTIFLLALVVNYSDIFLEPTFPPCIFGLSNPAFYILNMNKFLRDYLLVIINF